MDEVEEEVESMKAGFELFGAQFESFMKFQGFKWDSASNLFQPPAERPVSANQTPPPSRPTRPARTHPPPVQKRKVPVVDLTSHSSSDFRLPRLPLMVSNKVLWGSLVCNICLFDIFGYLLFFVDVILLNLFVCLSVFLFRRK